MKHTFQFLAGSSWMVYPDTVPHAVMVGQYARSSNTLLVESGVLVALQHAPLAVLEEIEIEADEAPGHLCS